jgi:hypothetical protein
VKFGLTGRADAPPAVRAIAPAPRRQIEFLPTSRIFPGINRKTKRLNAGRAPSGCEENMRSLVRRVLGVVAIIAIAMHATLWGVMAVQAAAGAPVDPFSVICHSGAATEKTGDKTPSDPAGSPTHACDHCTLCGTAAAPPIPQSVSAIRLLPMRRLLALTASPAVSRNGIAVGSTRARGPPASA